MVPVETVTVPPLVLVELTVRVHYIIVLVVTVGLYFIQRQVP